MIMLRRDAIQDLLLILPLCLIPSSESYIWDRPHTALCQRGEPRHCKRFGPRNAYLCHCRGNVACDKVTGACPDDACVDGFLGPSCQYVVNKIKTGPDWLTDFSESTCNDGSVQFVNVTLEEKQHLTRIRIVVKEPEQLNKVYVTYPSDGFSSPTSCSPDLRAKVNEWTVDLYCPSQRPTKWIVVSGKGVTGLCAVYVTAGRNIALDPRAVLLGTCGLTGDQPCLSFNQSVDGSLDLAANCSHVTRQQLESAEWTLHLPDPIDLTALLAYTTDGTFQGVKVYVLNAGQTDFERHTQAPLHSENVYRFIPRERKTITAVRFTKAEGSFKICEALIYGDSVCPNGTFGWHCENHCNCADGGDCIASTGGCYKGCRRGLTGVDCSYLQFAKRMLLGSATTNATSSYTSSVQTKHLECVGHCRVGSCTGFGQCIHGCKDGYVPPRCKDECSGGTYGRNCYETCSENCVPTTTSQTCWHTNGTCYNGCVQGYNIPLCTEECPAGRYGANCDKTCSKNCAPTTTNDTCWRTNGSCYDGCVQGYSPPLCIEECSNGTYGKDCTESCSDHCAVDNSCNSSTGACIYGCTESYVPPLCVTDRRLESKFGIVMYLFIFISAGTLIVCAYMIFRATKPIDYPTQAEDFSYEENDRKSTHLELHARDEDFRDELVWDVYCGPDDYYDEDVSKKTASAFALPGPSAHDSKLSIKKYSQENEQSTDEPKIN